MTHNKQIINEYMKRPAKKQIIFAISKKRKISPSLTKNFHFSIYPSTDVKNNNRCSIKYKYTDETLLSASNVVEKQKKKKFSWSSFLFLVFNVIIIVAIFIIQSNSQEGIISIGELFSADTFSLKFFFILITVFILQNSFEALKYYLLIFKITKRKRRALSYKVMALGKYYDCVSPLSAAGEPFQIYYLNKRGVRGEKATSIPILRLIVWQFVFSIISIILVIVNHDAVMSINVAIVAAAWIGIIINASIFAIIILLSVSKKIGPKLVIMVLKLLYKLKIVKNYQHSFRKVMRFVSSYQLTIKNFASDPGLILSEIIVTFIEIVLNSSLVYVIYLTLNNGTPFVVGDLIKTISMLIILSQASCFMPTPGSSGAIEFIFTVVFGALFSGSGTIFWALLIWRFFTYYIYIIQGLLILLYDFLIGNKKAEKLNELGYWNDTKKINKMFFKVKSNKFERKILLNDKNIQKDIKSKIILCAGIIKGDTNNKSAVKSNTNSNLKYIKKLEVMPKHEIEQKKKASIDKIRSAQENIKNERKLVAELKKEERKLKNIEKEFQYRKKLEKKIELERREQLKKELMKKN